MQQSYAMETLRSKIYLRPRQINIQNRPSSFENLDKIRAQPNEYLKSDWTGNAACCTHAETWTNN